MGGHDGLEAKLTTFLRKRAGSISGDLRMLVSSQNLLRKSAALALSLSPHFRTTASSEVANDVRCSSNLAQLKVSLRSLASLL